MTEPIPDPVLVSSRREALVIGVLFVVAMTYTVTVCAVMGYNRDPATLKFVLGFPDWIFWGIVLPWAVCVVASLILGSIFMKDEDLGEEGGGLTDSPERLELVGDAAASKGGAA